MDEIGELPLALQAKLPHVVQDLQFSRIGGRELIGVGTRIIASTNRNLEVALAKASSLPGCFHVSGRRYSYSRPLRVTTGGSDHAVWDAARLIARRRRVAVAAVPRISARDSHRRSNNSAADGAS